MTSTRSQTIKFALSAILLLVLFTLDVAVGTVSIPLSDVGKALFDSSADPTASIVVHIRLIKAITAVLAGAALSVSGLQMQTLFRNPLAGPYVLGISSGASLGVALFLLATPLLTLPVKFASIGIASAAWIGAALVLGVIAIVSVRIKDIMVILILGIMFSSAIGSIVQILQYASDEQSLKSFVVWTMGSLGEVTSDQLLLLSVAIAAGMILAIALIKPMNLLIFGYDYATTMGMNLTRTRNLLFASTTLLAGTTTAFCGPIGFIGLAMPHIARSIFSTSNNRTLLPATLLLGAVVMLGCDIIVRQTALPLNAITSLLGAPVVVWIVLKKR